MKKRFVDTKLGKIVSKVAPSVLDLIGDTVPGGAVVAELLKGKIKEDQLLEFQQALTEYVQSDYELLLTDLADARSLQRNSIESSDFLVRRFLYFLAAFWSVVAFVYIVGITFWQIPESSTRFADTVLGFLLGTVISAIIQFFFGSSIGSRMKDARG